MATGAPTIHCDGAVSGSTFGRPSTCGGVAPDSFYNFYADSGGSYVFDACGSSYDTYLRVYSGRSSCSKEVVACDDCGPCGFNTVLTTTLSKPGWYTILMEGFA
jgi:hypothetical protein